MLAVMRSSAEKREAACLEPKEGARRVGQPVGGRQLGEQLLLVPPSWICATSRLRLAASGACLTT